MELGNYSEVLVVRRQAAGSSAGFCCILITEINLITATRRRR